MSSKRLLIANRGEIAIRIIRAAAELGFESVAIYSKDDSESLHIRKADDAIALTGRGAQAYLDQDQIVAKAIEAKCTYIHPGYGFLSENAVFAQACLDAGLTFVGPTPESLALFGDKVAARRLAKECGVPLLQGTNTPVTLEEARAFFDGLGDGGAMVIKAVSGGGGRGMRLVRQADEIENAYERCRSEAKQAFGDGDVYVERAIERARHIEVQIAGDGSGGVVHFCERECSLQRRHQKLIELAPSPHLSTAVRDAITRDAVNMAKAASYQGLGTFEFLVDTQNETFFFIEANARLQVEHTVTEEITDQDLVKVQLEIAQGKSLESLKLNQQDLKTPRGSAVQLRINMETMGPDGTTRPAGGTLTAFEPPSGPGIRVDTFGYGGYRTSPAFDSLLAKLIIHSSSSSLEALAKKAYRALCEFRIEGVETNLSFLQNLVQHPDFVSGNTYTRFVDDHVADIVTADAVHPKLYVGQASTQSRTDRQAGAQIDTSDPLAVLHHGKNGEPSPQQPATAPVVDAIGGPEGTAATLAPIQGTIVSVDVSAGDSVHAGQQVIVMEAMKMEHVITAGASGRIAQMGVAPGDTVFEGHPLLFVEPGDVGAREEEAQATVDPDHIRPDLKEVLDRHETGLDPARPEAIAKRHKINHRSARENIGDLVDNDTFVEYGPLTIAAQRRRRSVEELIEKTPADGMIAGVGNVNGGLFGNEASKCAVVSYDYTVLAGTQGAQNHRKKDRIFEIAEQQHLPVIFFTEGGGGRPGDTDGLGVAGLDCLAFTLFGGLSGLVPLVGINAGRCFAGNASLLGCCDVIIATADSTIGMGGPAMIEGGNLGIYRPEEVGPMSVQVPNGVVDIAVEDEAEAVAVAKQYLSYFQGAVGEWSVADQRTLRSIIPENRLRIYDVRGVINTLTDEGSVLEIRRGFGLGMVTVLARVEGKPIGIIANNPTHLAGAIDSDGADKAARFMQLCDAFDLPILMLCDTPGIMVGPEVEKTALVRHANRLFVTGASLTVPFFTIVLRKGYGLGAQAMAGGSFKGGLFTISWPTGEFGGMGLEGAVKLGYRNELAAIEDPAERKAAFDEMVDAAYRRGKAVNVATHFEIDEVIDPSDSRRWILSAIDSAPPPAPRTGKKRPMIDTW